MPLRSKPQGANFGAAATGPGVCAKAIDASNSKWLGVPGCDLGGCSGRLLAAAATTTIAPASTAPAIPNVFIAVHHQIGRNRGPPAWRSNDTRKSSPGQHLGQEPAVACHRLPYMQPQLHL